MTAPQANPGERPSRSHRGPISLRALLALHVAGALLAAWAASRAEPEGGLVMIVWVAILWSQTCLLGAWLGLGMSSWRLRVLAGSLGIVSPAMAWGFVACSVFPGDAFYVGLLIAIPVMIVPATGTASVLLVVRRWKARLQRLAPRVSPPHSERLQFSIGHLLLLTVAVAALLAAAGGMRGFLSDPSFPFYNVVLYNVVLIGLLGVCVTFAALAAVWATLGAGRPWERIPIALLSAALAGLFCAYCDPHLPWRKLWEIPTAITLHAIVMVASLLVVRSYGYRFVSVSTSVEKE